MTSMHSTISLATPEERSWLTNSAIVLGASVIIALFSPFVVYLPFSPVPIATQPQVVLLLAALLGSKRGVMAVLAFIFQGAIGLPVFAGGASGVLALAGPTGGYLLGYVAAAYVTGCLVERSAVRTVSRTFLVMGLGNLTIFAFGVAWLSRFIGWHGAFLYGMLPFLIGDLFKLILATKTLKSFRFFKD